MRWLPRVQDEIQRAGIDDALELYPEMVAKVLTRETVGGKGIALLGPTGNGKTRRMRFMSRFLGIRIEDAKIIVEMIRKNDSVTFFREITRTDIRHGEEVPPRYYDLIIDDLGFEDERSVSYGNARDIMESVLQARYMVFPEHRTHFTSNKTPAELKARYGDRIWSRLNEMCAFVAMPGGDRRMQGQGRMAR